MTVNVCVMSNL